ncbi:MAG: site-specific DNA-methyltransferase, partial [Euryarchaeota archaeon]|nr:site-specific DNA-methyltransferase [Euryarchaeota archaeon]
YLSRIGDRDETGYMTREGLFRTNSKDSGHYHSNWLSMMYPRLFLARNLLKEDGVIFVSIDDNEVHNLWLLMNEVFGEENFVANFPRVTKKAGKTTDTIAKNNDYVLCYQKTENSELNSYSHTDEGYKNCDEFEEIRGKYKLSQPLDYGSIQYSPSLDYEIEIKGMVLRPGNVESKEMDERKKRNPSSDFCWRWSKDLYQFGLKNGFIVLKESKNGFRIYTKTYEKATISKNNNGYFVEIKQRTKSATTLDFIENEYSNDNSRKDIGKVFDGKVFEYSKPVSLIKTLLFLSSNDSDIILDFFSGSCTTAQAVLDINHEDSGSRKFICVQLPEKCDENSEAYKAGYKTIAEIGKERIRRVIKKIKEDKQTKLDVDSNLGKQDLGFKVFKLQESNFKIWRSDVKTEEELFIQLKLHTDPVDKNAKIENILYELLLKSGVPLTARIEEKDGYYRVNNGEIILILKRIDEGIIKTVISEKPKKVITLDRLFKNNDQLKTNTALQLKDSEIDFRTV